MRRLNTQTIQSPDGLHGQDLLFDNPHNYNPFVAKLSGGYDTTFSTHTGATLVTGYLEIRKGIMEIDRIVIQ